MKKNLLLLFIVLASTFYSCKKQASTDNLVTGTKLLTLNITPGLMLSSTNYFVITDENGKVVCEKAYQPGGIKYELSSDQPFDKDRVNLYIIRVWDDTGLIPSVEGYLQVKKGSVYTQTSLIPSVNSNYPLNIHLKNVTFNVLDLSTDESAVGSVFNADTARLKNLIYSDNSKLWVQIQKNTQKFYHIFDIDKGTHDLNVDLSQCTTPSIVKTISAPGNDFDMLLYGKYDVTTTWQYDHDYEYGLGQTYTPGNSMQYYMPSEFFKQYIADAFYTIGDYRYRVLRIGDSVPDKIDSFDASFGITGTSIADFKPSFTGSFNFYMASFVKSDAFPKISVDVYSPSVANYTNIKFPDFSKYVGTKSLDPSLIKLRNVGLYQQNVFDETQFPYQDSRNYHYMNSKSVQKDYTY
jgi:hypothetical protein